MKYDVKRFGIEQEPVVIIDDFFSKPEQLTAHATRVSFNKNNSFYPGIRAVAPNEYLAERMDVLREILQKYFELQHGAALMKCNYSMVTTLAEDLMPFQCFPHFDGSEKGLIAVLHYLCNEQTGGTAFYRHKQTGFEAITASRQAEYTQAREIEYKNKPLETPAYISGSSQEFEQIGRIDAKYNRLILYRGYALHSGQITDNFNFSPDPKKGRLTINTFLLDQTKIIKP